ncbi:toxin glutamine deamidase domain-containing protein [Streptomyces sp. NPDC050263]|uniref:WXG100-like domain-containing protein n=1 Tax=Streptomyces sp. NPDC050263 TaxID=3155037 RepID=UPI00343E45CE
MAIELSPEMRAFMMVVAGQPFPQANEDLAAASEHGFRQLAGQLRDFSDLLRTTSEYTAQALPASVGRSFLTAIRSLTDDGGVNHLREFAGEMDAVADGRLRMALDITETKWSIFAELVRLILEIKILLLVAFFTGGSAASQVPRATARSRATLLTYLAVMLSRAQQYLGLLTGAADEALQTLIVRLALMVGGPREYRPDHVDWGAVGMGAAFGGVAGFLGGGLGLITRNLRDLGDPDVFNGGGIDSLFRNPPSGGLGPVNVLPSAGGRGSRGLGSHAVDVGDSFVVDGLSETVAEVLVMGAFGQGFVWNWSTFWSSGVMSMVEGGAERGAEKFGASLRNIFGPSTVNTVSGDTVSRGGGSASGDRPPQADTATAGTTLGGAPVRGAGRGQTPGTTGTSANTTTGTASGRTPLPGGQTTRDDRDQLLHAPDGTPHTPDETVLDPDEATAPGTAVTPQGQTTTTTTPAPPRAGDLSGHATGTLRTTSPGPASTAPDTTESRATAGASGRGPRIETPAAARTEGLSGTRTDSASGARAESSPTRPETPAAGSRPGAADTRTGTRETAETLSGTDETTTPPAETDDTAGNATAPGAHGAAGTATGVPGNSATPSGTTTQPGGGRSASDTADTAARQIRTAAPDRTVSLPSSGTGGRATQPTAQADTTAAEPALTRHGETPEAADGLLAPSALNLVSVSPATQASPGRVTDRLPTGPAGAVPAASADSAPTGSARSADDRGGLQRFVADSTPGTDREPGNGGGGEDSPWDRLSAEDRNDLLNEFFLSKHGPSRLDGLSKKEIAAQVAQAYDDPRMRPIDSQPLKSRARGIHQFIDSGRVFPLLGGVPDRPERRGSRRGNGRDTSTVGSTPGAGTSAAPGSLPDDRHPTPMDVDGQASATPSDDRAEATMGDQARHLWHQPPTYQQSSWTDGAQFASLEPAHVNAITTQLEQGDNITLEDVWRGIYRTYGLALPPEEILRIHTRHHAEKVAATTPQRSDFGDEEVAKFIVSFYSRKENKGRKGRFPAQGSTEPYGGGDFRIGKWFDNRKRRQQGVAGFSPVLKKALQEVGFSVARRDDGKWYIEGNAGNPVRLSLRDEEVAKLIVSFYDREENKGRKGRFPAQGGTEPYGGGDFRIGNWFDNRKRRQQGVAGFSPVLKKALQEVGFSVAQRNDGKWHIEEMLQNPAPGLVPGEGARAVGVGLVLGDGERQVVAELFEVADDVVERPGPLMDFIEVWRGMNTQLAPDNTVSPDEVITAYWVLGPLFAEVEVAAEFIGAWREMSAGSANNRPLSEVEVETAYRVLSADDFMNVEAGIQLVWTWRALDAFLGGVSAEEVQRAYEEAAQDRHSSLTWDQVVRRRHAPVVQEEQTWDQVAPGEDDFYAPHPRITPASTPDITNPGVPSPAPERDGSPADSLSGPGPDGDSKGVDLAHGQVDETVPHEDPSAGPAHGSAPHYPASVNSASAVAVAARHGLRMGEVPGDGDCFMSSLAQLLPQVDGQVWSAGEVRRQIAEALVADLRQPPGQRQLWPHLEPALEQHVTESLARRASGTGAGELSWQERIQVAVAELQLSGGVTDSHRHGFAELMARPGEWQSTAGDVAPVIAALHWNVRLRVVQVAVPATGAPEESVFTTGQTGPVMHLVRQFQVREGRPIGEHWSPARPDRSLVTGLDRDALNWLSADDLLVLWGQDPVTAEENEHLQAQAGTRELTPVDQATAVIAWRQTTSPLQAAGRPPLTLWEIGYAAADPAYLLAPDTPQLPDWFEGLNKLIEWRQVNDALADLGHHPADLQELAQALRSGTPYYAPRDIAHIITTHRTTSLPPEQDTGMHPATARDTTGSSMTWDAPAPVAWDPARPDAMLPEAEDVATSGGSNSGFAAEEGQEPSPDGVDVAGVGVDADAGLGVGGGQVRGQVPGMSGGAVGAWYVDASMDEANALFLRLQPGTQKRLSPQQVAQDVAADRDTGPHTPAHATHPAPANADPDAYQDLSHDGGPPEQSGTPRDITMDDSFGGLAMDDAAQVSMLPPVAIHAPQLPDTGADWDPVPLTEWQTAVTSLYEAVGEERAGQIASGSDGVFMPDSQAFANLAAVLHPNLTRHDVLDVIGLYTGWDFSDVGQTSMPTSRLASLVMQVRLVLQASPPTGTITDTDILSIARDDMFLFEAPDPALIAAVLSVLRTPPAEPADPEQTEPIWQFGSHIGSPFIGGARTDDAMRNGLARALADAKAATPPNPHLIQRLETALGAWTGPITTARATPGPSPLGPPAPAPSVDTSSPVAGQPTDDNPPAPHEPTPFEPDAQGSRQPTADAEPVVDESADIRRGVGDEPAWQPVVDTEGPGVGKLPRQHVPGTPFVKAVAGPTGAASGLRDENRAGFQRFLDDSNTADASAAPERPGVGQRQATQRAAAPEPAAVALRDAVAKAIEQVARDADVEVSVFESSPTVLNCVLLLDALAGELYPAGDDSGGRLSARHAIRPATALDDLAVGTPGTEQRFARGPGWGRVGSWESLVEAVREAGVGATALILVQRPSGAGHAFAVHRSADGVHWIDPQAPERGLRVRTAGPGTAAAGARAVVVDASGRVVEDALRRWPSVPHTDAEALLDSPKTPDEYGAIGLEVEDLHPLVGGNLEYGALLARNVRHGQQLVVDHDDFYTLSDGRWFYSRLDAVDAAGGQEEPIARELPIPELVSLPLGVLPGESGRLSGHDGMAAHVRTRHLLRRTDDERREIPLDELLPAGEGWDITPEGQEVVVYPSPAGKYHAAYTQFTVGVPIGGVSHLLALVQDRLALPSLTKAAAAASDFADDLTARFAFELLGREVRAEQLPYLSGVAGVDELHGYAWLMFSHVSASPLRERVFRRGLVKNRLPAALRNPFHVLRRSLSGPVRSFLQDNESFIVERFQSVLRETVAGYADEMKVWIDTRNIMNGTTHKKVPHMDYLVATIRGVTRQGATITQFDTVGMEDFAELDTSNGNVLPLALLELRNFIPDHANHPRLTDSHLMDDKSVRAVFDELAAATNHAYRMAERFQSGSGGLAPATAAAILDQSLVQRMAWLLPELGKLTAPGPSGTFQPLMSRPERQMIADAITQHIMGTPLPPRLWQRLRGVRDTLYQAEIAQGISADVRSHVVTARAEMDAVLGVPQQQPTALSAAPAPAAESHAPQGRQPYIGMANTDDSLVPGLLAVLREALEKNAPAERLATLTRQLGTYEHVMPPARLEEFTRLRDQTAKKSGHEGETDTRPRDTEAANAADATDPEAVPSAARIDVAAGPELTDDLRERLRGGFLADVRVTRSEAPPADPPGGQPAPTESGLSTGQRQAAQRAAAPEPAAPGGVDQPDAATAQPRQVDEPMSSLPADGQAVAEPKDMTTALPTVEHVPSRTATPMAQPETATAHIVVSEDTRLPEPVGERQPGDGPVPVPVPVTRGAQDGADFVEDSLLRKVTDAGGGAATGTHAGTSAPAGPEPIPQDRPGQTAPETPARQPLTEEDLPLELRELLTSPGVLAVQVAYSDVADLPLDLGASAQAQLAATTTVRELGLSLLGTHHLATRRPELFPMVAAMPNGPGGRSTAPEPDTAPTADALREPAVPANDVPSHTRGRLTPIPEQPASGPDGEGLAQGRGILTPPTPGDAGAERAEPAAVVRDARDAADGGVRTPPRNGKGRADSMDAPVEPKPVRYAEDVKEASAAVAEARRALAAAGQWREEEALRREEGVGTSSDAGGEGVARADTLSRAAGEALVRAELRWSQATVGAPSEDARDAEAESATETGPAAESDTESENSSGTTEQGVVAPAVDRDESGPQPQQPPGGPPEAAWAPSAGPVRRRSSPAVARFGREGVTGMMTFVGPVPQQTITWLRDQVISEVEGATGRDQALRTHVGAVLNEQALSAEWARLLSDSGLPVMVPHRGRERYVVLRLSLSDPEPADPGIEQMPDGPPVNTQRFVFAATEPGELVNVSDLRTVPVEYARTVSATNEGVFRRVTLTPRIQFVYNQMTTGMSTSATTQPMTVIRNAERTWPFAYRMGWTVKVTESLSEALAYTQQWTPPVPAPDGDVGVAGDRLTVWFPQHLVDTDGTDAAARGSKDPARQAADLDTLVNSVPLLAVENVPNAGTLLNNLLNSIPLLKTLSENSLHQLSQFFGETSLRANLPLMYGGGHMSPTLYTKSRSVLGVLQVKAVLFDRAVIGPSTQKSSLEPFVVRSVRTVGSASVSNAASFSLAVTLALGTGALDPVTGVEPRGATVTGQGGVQHQFAHTLQSGGSTKVARTLRTKEPLLQTSAMVKFEVALIRPEGPRRALEATNQSQLKAEVNHSVVLRVPSAATVPVQSEPQKRHLPPELLHLRSVGASAVPTKVDGADGLFEVLEAWLGDQGFLPPAEALSARPFLTEEALHTQRLSNLRELNLVRSDPALRAGFDEMVQGGQRMRFKLPTATDTQWVSVRITAERRDLGAVDGGVVHQQALEAVQTMNVTGIATSGEEQFNHSPLSLSGRGEISLTNPLNAVGDRELQGATAEYGYTRQPSVVTGAKSGTASDYIVVSPMADGTQIFKVPVTYRMEISWSHGAVPPPWSGDGSVFLAVPTYRTLAEAHTAVPLPPPGPRRITPEDADGPAGAVRMPVTAMPDRVEGGHAVHRAVNEMLESLAAKARQSQEQAAAVLRPAMPGGFPDEPAADGAQVSAADEEQVPRADVPQGPGADVPQVPAADGAQVPAAPTGTAAAQADPPSGASPLNSGLGLLHWAADQAGGALRRTRRLMVGEDERAAESMAQEVFAAAFSPLHMLNHAPRLFRDSYVVEGAGTSGVLAGTDIMVEVRGRLTDLRRLSAPSAMYMEREIGAVDGATHTVNDNRRHEYGVGLAAEYGGTSRRLVPSGKLVGQRQSTQSDTTADVTTANRITTEDGVVPHRFSAKATYEVTVRVGSRNVVWTTAFPEGTAEDARIVEVPDAVELLLTDNDLLEYPEFKVAGTPELPERPEKDRLLPAWFRQQNRSMGFGVVMQVDPSPAAPSPATVAAGVAAGDGTAVGRRDGGSFQHVIRGAVEGIAPGVTRPGSPVYLPGVLSVINDHGTGYGMNAIAHAGPEARTSFHFVYRSWLGPKLVSVTLNARPDDDLPKATGRFALSGAGIETMYNRNNGEGSLLPVPGSTRHALTIARGVLAEFTPMGRLGDHRVRPAFAVNRLSEGTEAVTSSRERRSYQRSSGDTTEFVLRYKYTVSVRSRFLTEALIVRLPLLAVQGLGSLGHALTGAEAGQQLQLLTQGATQTDDPTWSAQVRIRFNGSETPRVGEGAPTRPDAVKGPLQAGLYTDDPTAAPEPSTPSDAVAVEMGVPVATRTLLHGTPTWLPTRPFGVYDFDGTTHFAMALREVDHALGSEVETSTSLEGMLIRLGLIAATGLDTPLSPAATAPFLGRQGTAGTSVKIRLYAPQSLSHSVDTAIDRVEIPIDGASTEATLTIGPSLTVSPNLGLGGAGTDRLGLPGPIAGELVTAGQSVTFSSGQRGILRFGTTAAGAEQGAIGHVVSAVAVFTVSGPDGIRYVVGNMIFRTTETPPGQDSAGEQPQQAGPAPQSDPPQEPERTEQAEQGPADAGDAPRGALPG